MNYKFLKKINSSNKDFELKKIFSSSSVDLIHLTLKPNEIIDRQAHPTKTCFFVISGKAIVEVATERKVVEKETIIEIEKNTEVGWINVQDKCLELIVLKIKN